MRFFAYVPGLAKPPRPPSDERWDVISENEWRAIYIALRRLRAELAERNERLEELKATALIDDCSYCGEPRVSAYGMAYRCPAWRLNGGRCDAGTALACCECLCGEEDES